MKYDVIHYNIIQLQTSWRPEQPALPHFKMIPLSNWLAQDREDSITVWTSGAECPGCYKNCNGQYSKLIQYLSIFRFTCVFLSCLKLHGGKSTSFYNTTYVVLICFINKTWVICTCIPLKRLFKSIFCVLFVPAWYLMCNFVILPLFSGQTLKCFITSKTEQTSDVTIRFKIFLCRVQSKEMPKIKVR